LAKEYLQILMQPINPEYWRGELEIFFKNKKISRRKKENLLEEILDQISEIKKFLENLQNYIPHTFWRFKTKFQTAIQHFEIDFFAGKRLINLICQVRFCLPCNSSLVRYLYHFLSVALY
jgi:hypothetical protein